MAVIVGHRSPSPLTASNSSSLRSSSITSNDESFTDNMHFEEIGLDDEPNRMAWKSAGRSASSSRDLTVPTSYTNSIPRRKSYDPRGDIPLDKRPPLSTPLPKRGLSSLSTSSLALGINGRHGRTRPPSPLKHAARPSLSRPVTAGPPIAAQPRALPVRPHIDTRISSQKSRKSAQQLEDEYDDLDEHLPDDASLWNVPISPRPSMGRSPSSPVGLLDGKDFLPGSPMTAIHGAATPRQSFSNKPAKSPVSPIRPPFVKSPEIMREVSRSSRKASAELLPRPQGFDEQGAPNIPGHSPFPKSRAKSWSAAMSDLSEEARVLTGVLESYAVFADNGSLKGSTVDQDDKTRRIVRPKTIDLPPLRTGNVMIDPLPISKEKEKVLSRTRPSWLPPKSRSEERRHLREYQQMMERSQRSGMLSDASICCDMISKMYAQTVEAPQILPKANASRTTLRMRYCVSGKST